MQLMGSTHQYFGGSKNELHDHLLRVSTKELVDPSCNISAGVRWLFRKKETASALLKRHASWEETVEDYKALLSKRLKGLPYNPKPMNDASFCNRTCYLTATFFNLHFFEALNLYYTPIMVRIFVNTMKNKIIAEITDGLMSGAITLKALSEVCLFDLTVTKYLGDLIKKGNEGNKIASEQITTTLTNYLTKTHAVEDDSMESSSGLGANLAVGSAGILMKEAKSMGAQNMLDTAVEANPITSHIPIFGLAAYSVGQYQYGEKITELTSSMQQLIRQVETDCKQQHQLYHLISQSYLQKLQADISVDEKKTIINEWHKTHDYFENHIQKSQQNIAILGAKIQETNSQKRYKGARVAVNLASIGLHLIGPVGTALSSVLAGANSVIGAGGTKYTGNSAKYNHMVLLDPSISIENQDGLLKGLDIIRRISAAKIKFEYPSITYKGTAVDSKVIPRTKLDKEKFCTKICRQLAKTIPPLVVCRFPNYEITQPKEKNSNDSDDPLAMYIDNLHTQQKETVDAYLFYTFLTRELIKAYPNNDYPAVSNITEIEADLQRKLDAIDVQINQLVTLESAKYRGEKLSLLKSYQDLLHVQKDTLKELSTSLNEGKYRRYLDSADVVSPNDVAFDNYVIWQKKNINFQCDSLSKLLEPCSQMRQGRHIHNLPKLLDDIIHEMKSIQSRLSDEESRSLEAKITNIVNLSVLTDEARVEELIALNENHPGIVNEAQLQRELLDSKAKLISYPEQYAKNERFKLIATIDRLLKDMSLVNGSADEINYVAKNLAHISPLNCDQIRSENTLVITPSRLEFGWSKRDDQFVSVNAAVDRVVKQDANIKEIQILPLQPFNQESWLAAMGEEKKLADSIEGLKTEMQWVNQFYTESVQRRLETTIDTRISVTNLQDLRNCYAAQIDFIQNKLTKRDAGEETVYASHYSLDSDDIRNKMSKLGTMIGNAARPSSVGKVVFQNAQEQLDKCINELAHLDDVILQEQQKNNAIQSVSMASNNSGCVSHFKQYKTEYLHTHPVKKENMTKEEEDKEGEGRHQEM